MMEKTFTFVGILAVLLLAVSVVSAAPENGFEISVIGAGSTSTNRISGNPGDVVTFSVQFNNSNATYQDINLSLSGTDITFLERSITGDDTFAVSFTIPTTQATQYRSLSGIVNSSNTIVGTISDIVYYTVITATSSNTLCELEGYTDQGDLEISDFDVNNRGDGSEDEWQFLDEIEVVVEIENTNKDDNVDDVEVMIVIYDNKIENGGNDVTNDFDFEDEILTDIGRLKDDDQESVTFIIKELPADLEDGTYYMYIMAYEDTNEENQCISESNKLDDDYYFKFTVESVDSEDSVVARGSELQAVVNTYCDQKSLEISVPVYNLGVDDQEKVLVNIYNAELGIDEYATIDDLNNGDKEVVRFFINIPSDLSKDKYDLDITVYFDWDNDEDDEDITAYDEQTSDRSIRLDILSCTIPKPTVTANLDSEAMIGENLVVKAIITNNGNNNDFVISVSNFETWANLVSVEPQTASINKGEFEEVTITLIPTKEGAQSFRINTIVDGQSEYQTVSVNIAGKPGLFPGISNTLVYIIIGIIVLLILIFLVLIIRLARRPAKPQF